MKSFTTPDFWEAYAQLNSEVKEKAQKAYQLWQENPLHPSLHFKVAIALDIHLETGNCDYALRSLKADIKLSKEVCLPRIKGT